MPGNFCLHRRCLIPSKGSSHQHLTVSFCGCRSQGPIVPVFLMCSHWLRLFLHPGSPVVSDGGWWWVQRQVFVVCCGRGFHPPSVRIKPKVCIILYYAHNNAPVVGRLFNLSVHILSRLSSDFPMVIGTSHVICRCQLYACADFPSSFPTVIATLFLSSTERKV